MTLTSTLVPLVLMEIESCMNHTKQIFLHHEFLIWLITTTYATKTRCGVFKIGSCSGGGNKDTYQYVIPIGTAVKNSSSTESGGS